MKINLWLLVFLSSVAVDVAARSYFYDAADRLILVADADGAAAHYVYDEVTNLLNIESTTVPAAPSELTAERLDARQAQLNWRDNANNETGFRVQRRDAENDLWEEVGFVVVNGTSFTDSELEEDKNYVYRLVALDSRSGFTSAYSNSVAAAGRESEPFVISKTVATDRSIVISFETEVDSIYAIEQSLTLEENSWIPVLFKTSPSILFGVPFIIGPGGSVNVYVDKTVANQGFYRVLKR